MKKDHFNITVCENPKFIWFRNAKVATRSIKWVIDQQFETQEFYSKSIKSYHLSEYFTFGFVRNPVTRIISAYFNKIVRHFNKNPSEIKPTQYQYLKYFPDYQKTSNKEGFKILLNTLIAPENKLIKNIHFLPQYQLIDPTKLSFLGKFENIEKDTQYVFQKINANFLLPHKNPGPPNLKNNFIRQLDKDDFQIIYQLYQKDFEIFNYSIHV